MAKDGGTPPKTATATVEVDVERNLHDPVFTSSGVMTASIPEIAPAGTPVASVSAEDRDTAVRHILDLGKIYNRKSLITYF